MTPFLTSPSQVVLAVGLMLFASVLANKFSDRLGVPTLLMFLCLGMLAGSDGIGGIYFDNAAVANFIGVFALAYILFAGGLDTNWPTVRPVLGRALALSTLGVLVTAALVGFFTWRMLGFPLKESLLLGAIVSSTDAAAVFSTLRSRGVGLRGRLKPLLELESGSNDPMAVFLTMAVIGTLGDATAPWGRLVWSLAVNMVCGAAVGAAVGFAASWIFNRLRLEYEGLYPVLGMSVVLLTYGLAEALAGNGFLAVYVCGVVMGSQDFLHKHYLTKFHDGLSWLMQIILFFTLGLLVFPSQLPAVAAPALAVAACLMFVARPLAVYLGLAGSRFSWAERTLTAWTGLRGAVPIVLATFPLSAGYDHANEIFNIVFFVVLSSVLLQGKTLMLSARWLRVDEPLVARPRYPLEFERLAGMRDETREVDIAPEAAVVGRVVSELGLPQEALILLIRRGQRFLVPKGRTKLEPFDTLLVIADRDALPKAQAILRAPRDAGGGMGAAPPPGEA